MPDLYKNTAELENYIKAHKSCIIAIDGKCGSGKSTIGNYLAARYNTALIHMDDFYLPLKLRTKTRLTVPGGNVHYERFFDEVISKLQSKEPFSYKYFDCRTMSYGESIRIRPKDITIIEGSYSHHPYFGEYADLKVFMTVPEDIQKKRILTRHDADKLKEFEKRWIPLENRYFEFYNIEENADMVINNI